MSRLWDLIGEVVTAAYWGWDWLRDLPARIDTALADRPNGPDDE